MGNGLGSTTGSRHSAGMILPLLNVVSIVRVLNSASRFVSAAWDNRLLYMKKVEIARLQALQSVESISTKGGKAPHDTLGNDPRKTIVLSDDALAKFTAGDQRDQTDGQRDALPAWPS